MQTHIHTTKKHTIKERKCGTDILNWKVIQRERERKRKRERVRDSRKGYKKNKKDKTAIGRIE